MTPDTADLLGTRLTPEQRAAATDPAPNVLTLACAGSGKSRTLAYRIVRLLSEGCRPDGIVAFTFTEKAAGDLKARIAEALATAGMAGTILGAMFVGTIHSYCEFVLKQIDARYRQFDVLDDNKLKLYLMSRYPQLGLDKLRNAHPTSQGARAFYFVTVDQVSRAWRILNDEMLAIADVGAMDPLLGETLGRIQQALLRDHFFEFSSMVRLAAEALAAGGAVVDRALAGLRHVMVDEYQDVNRSQEHLISALRPRCATLFVVGDDDQAIHAWRGADVSNILTFEHRYLGVSVQTLPTNFRSTGTIVQGATDFARGTLGAIRIDKMARWENRDGPRDAAVLQFATRDHEAQWVSDRIRALLGTRYVERDGRERGLTPADFAILMRSTRKSAWGNDPPKHTPFTAALAAAGIPYTVEAGGGVLDRPHAAAVVGVLELLRSGPPSRRAVIEIYHSRIQPLFAAADPQAVAVAVTDWGRRIHQPQARGVARQRIYPQELLHDIFRALGVGHDVLPEEVMFDLGVLSRIVQDVESVYVSIDSSLRFADLLNFVGNVGATGYDPASDDVVQRPDAVFVSTVHKAKGLEFPVVFVVGVEQGHFPGAHRGYDGWLPPAALASALARGRYAGSPEEEARLFYTAITRAERLLYVTAARQLPGAKRARNLSRFTAWLQEPAFHRDPTLTPSGLVPLASARRVEESLMPTSFTDLRYYIRCPKDYEFRKRYGFSPPIADLFGFGQSVHAVVGRLHERFPAGAPAEPEVEALAKDTFHLKHVPPSNDPAARPGPFERARDSAVTMAREYVRGYGADFARRREVEERFEVPVRGAVISGSIDLLLEEDEAGRVTGAEVVDFKTMGRGGDEPREEREPLRWTELALQVQLYAKAARDVLGAQAETGSVHLLKDGVRVQVPVDAAAVEAAVENMEWAIAGILARDFPMRPAADKCAGCDFAKLCPKRREEFSSPHPSTGSPYSGEARDGRGVLRGGLRGEGYVSRRTVIDLFSGIGGGGMGFVARGFEVVAAVEIDPDAARAYKANVGTAPVVSDIREVTGQHLLRVAGLARGECCVVVGCPPCQSFTVLRRGRVRLEIDAVRNTLPDHWLRLVDAIRPRHVVFENVPGLLRGDGEPIFERVLASLRSFGYACTWDIVDAAAYGVPQFRRRLLLIGSRVAVPRLPAPTHGDPASAEVRAGLLPAWTTVKQAFAGLPAPAGPGEEPALGYHRMRQHSDLCVRRLSALKEGQSQVDLPDELRLACHRGHDGHRDVYGRMLWGRPAPTLTSGCTNVTRGRFGHPAQPRAITLREAMRLQTFPDRTVLTGRLEGMAGQIGNAVPTRLLEVVADLLTEMDSQAEAPTG